MRIRIDYIIFAYMSNETNNSMIRAIEDTFGSIYAASQKLDVDYSTLYRWKHNIQSPNLKTIEKIVKDNPGLNKLFTEYRS